MFVLSQLSTNGCTRSNILKELLFIDCTVAFFYVYKTSQNNTCKIHLLYEVGRVTVGNLTEENVVQLCVNFLPGARWNWGIVTV
jgi:hypothetical protein